MSEKPIDIDAYIAAASQEAQGLLRQIRTLIRAMVPDATESISYDIPTYELDDEVLLHFASWTNHVSLYPVPPGDSDFDTELKKYQSGKGTARFPLDRPLPEDFVRRFVELHVQRIRPS